MSAEYGRELGGYLEYQQERRPGRVRTLGGAATVLFLATFDLGLSGAGDASAEFSGPAETPEATPVIGLGELRAARQRRLANLAADTAELGYATAA